MGNRRARRRPSAGVTIQSDPARVGPLLRDFGFVGCADDPVSVRSSFAPDGRPRSVKARYPGGWCCRLTLHKNGSYSLTQSISVTVQTTCALP